MVLRDSERAPRKLPAAALIFRVAHTGIAAGFLSAIVYIWWCAITGRRDRRLRIAIGALAIEGVLVVASRGDCPLGGMQTRLGDPTPLFELVLSPQLAKLAVPVLGATAGLGFVVVAQRPHGPWLSQ